MSCLCCTSYWLRHCTKWTVGGHQVGGRRTRGTAGGRWAGAQPRFQSWGSNYLVYRITTLLQKKIIQVYPVWCSRLRNHTLFIKKLCKKLGPSKFWRVPDPSPTPQWLRPWRWVWQNSKGTSNRYVGRFDPYTGLLTPKWHQKVLQESGVIPRLLAWRIFLIAPWLRC